MQNIVQLNVQKVKRCICFFLCIAYVTMLSSKVQYFLGNHLLVLCSSKVNLFFLQVQNRFLMTLHHFLPAPVKNVCSVRKRLLEPPDTSKSNTLRKQFTFLTAIQVELHMVFFVLLHFIILKFRVRCFGLVCFFQVVRLICYCQHLTPTLHFYSIHF